MGIEVFDVIAIVIVLVGILIGCSRGFMRELCRVVVFLGGVVCAKLISFPLESFVYKSLKIGEIISGKISEVVSHATLTTIDLARTSLSAELGKLPVVGDFATEIVNDWALVDAIQTGGNDIATTVTNVIYSNIEPFIHYVLQIFLFVILFFVLTTILSLVFKSLMNTFLSVKFLGTANAILGGVLGGLTSILVVLVIFSILFLVFTLSGSEYLPVLMNSRIFDIVNGVKSVIPI